MTESEDLGSVSIECLDERYRGFRIPRPRQEEAVGESMRRFGQLIPVVAVERSGALAMVDGFKRLQAARKIGLSSLDVRSLPLSEQAAVAAVYSLNRHGCGMTDMEEALVVRALCREHGLAQVEVGELLGRHKSWVSRRLMLIERLSAQVQNDVRVGLVSVTTARDIARLPRGNQSEVAVTVHRHGLTSREASLLVTLFEKTGDRTEQQELLDRPREALGRQRDGAKVVVYDARLCPGANQLRRLMLSVMSGVSRSSLSLCDVDPAYWTATERSVLLPLLRRTQISLSQLCQQIEEALMAMDNGDVP